MRCGSFSSSWGAGRGARWNFGRESAFRFEDRDAVRSAFANLRERGFLQRVPEMDTQMPAAGARRLYGCPILSLASYAAACEFQPHLAATLGDAAFTERQLQDDPGAVDTRDAMGRAPLHVAAEGREACGHQSCNRLQNAETRNPNFIYDLPFSADSLRNRLCDSADQADGTPDKIRTCDPCLRRAEGRAITDCF